MSCDDLKFFDSRSRKSKGIDSGDGHKIINFPFDCGTEN